MTEADDVYGRALLDHARWLHAQANKHRAGAERAALHAQAFEAREQGLLAMGFVLPARLLPFDTKFDMSPSLSDQDQSAEPRGSGWVCRYCRRGEGTYTGILHAPMTPFAEQGRAVTHEAMCTKRPVDAPVTDAELRIMGNYLRAWMEPRLGIVDEVIESLKPRRGYRQTDERNAELANWQVIRIEYLAILTRCGVDDAALAALPPLPVQTHEESVTEIHDILAASKARQEGTP